MEGRGEKEIKVQNWHKGQKDQISAPLIIDPTAGNMTREMKEVCTKFETVTGMRVVVQERAGDSIKHTARAEPLRNQYCGRMDCFTCSTGGGGKCEKNGSGYRIVCLTCQMASKVTEYEGETARNAYTRGIEHMNSLRLEDEENALWKHCLVDHGGEKAEFSMSVVGVHRTPLVRQINEAVRIVLSKAHCIMNSKSEWHQAPRVRVIPMCGLQGTGRGSLQKGGVKMGGRSGSPPHLIVSKQTGM